MWRREMFAVYSIIALLILLYVIAILFRIKKWREKRNSKEQDMEGKFPPYHIASLYDDENVTLFERKGVLVNVAYNPRILLLTK
ncbi:hypothetical protein XELAEV_18002904mg [Xenopus laevis]|nr:hypothetical protein XELAEV_18002904mg [Xenopus laevis]